MFAAALRETEARARAQRERERAAQAHAAALDAARLEVDRAIEMIRSAQRSGRSTAEADAAWRAAKARLIELETGTAPTWAPQPAAAADEADSHDEPPTDGAEHGADVDTDSAVNNG